MSMLCSLYRISPEKAARLKACPDAVGEFLGVLMPPPKVSFLSKLFGKFRNPPPPAERKFEPVAVGDTFELDQAWHILHFLFSGSNAEGALPAAFLLSGGEEIGPDLGYGPPRLLSPELSRAVAAFLAPQSFQTLDAAYITSKIEAAEIYWQALSDPTDRQRQVEELWRVVSELRLFFAHTVKLGHATLVFIF